MFIGKIGKWQIIALTAVVMASCSEISPTPKNVTISEQAVKALNDFCIQSESPMQNDIEETTMSAPGYTYGEDDRFRRQNLSVALGGEGMKFCDIQISHTEVDLTLLTQHLGDWALTQPVDLTLMEGPEKFESGDDVGTRIVWGREKVRLALYVYENDRSDGRRARIMFDAF